MIRDDEQPSTESESSDPHASEEPVPHDRAAALADELTGAEFEAAWSGLGVAASTAISEELARMATEERAPAPSDEIDVDLEDRAVPIPAPEPPTSSREAARRSVPPPPPPPTRSPPAVVAVTIDAPAERAIDREPSEPDLLALSRTDERSAAVAGAALGPAPQVVTVIQQAPRSTTERKLLLGLVVLLVAVNGYFLLTREHAAAREAARIDTPAPAPTSAPAPASIRDAPAPAPLPPPPSPTPKIVASPPAATPAAAPAAAPSDEPVVIAAEPTASQMPRAAPRKPRPKPRPLPPEPGDRRPPITAADPGPADPAPAAPTPAASPFDDGGAPEPPAAPP